MKDKNESMDAIEFADELKKGSSLRLIKDLDELRKNLSKSH